VQRPVAYCRYQFEFGSEATQAKANSAEALNLFDERELTPHRMGAPSTLNMRHWLDLADTINQCREAAVAKWKWGNILLCRE
jgi:hypothetical protein